MEILAPVGSPDALVAAIEGGADAVYLGGKQFGARKFSVNFDDGQLEGAISYAHDRDVKVYVTVNTLIKDTEMMDAVSYVRFLKNVHADAVIIQDIGFLNKIEKVDITKHASTQMGIHSPAGLQWCYENGISRAILSRELTMNEISNVIKDSPIETEVFVQGALCYSFSGGCLFSSLAGGRSGNRGECAQPCRKRYSSREREGYLMNTKDLFCLDIIDELRKIGIDSVKIEGRMRSPVHSYLTSKVYSMYEKGVPRDDIEEYVSLLKTIFNRGYGTGYMMSAKDIVQTVHPDNRGFFLGEVQVTKGRFDPSGMDVNVKDGISIFSGEDKVGGFKVPDTAVSVPFKIRDGVYQIYRTYDPRIDIVKNTFPTVPDLIGRTRRPPSARLSDPVPRGRSKADISVYVSSVKVLDSVKGYANRIYFEHPVPSEAERICADNDIELVTILPRFDTTGMSIEGNVMINNAGQIPGDVKNVYGSYHMNAFNSFFPPLHQTTLSVELSRNEIRGILGRRPGRVEIMVFGRVELMYTRDPDMATNMIIDEKGFEFPVYHDSRGWTHILNSSDLMLLDHLDEMERMGVDSFGIDMRRRPAELASLVVKAFAERDTSKKERIREMCGSITYGHYLKGLS